LNESAEEISSIAYLVFENLLGLSRTEILSGKYVEVTDEKMDSLLSVVKRINKHEPIQFILEEADFFGRKIFVNNSVLIPRPETEELVRLIIDECGSKKNLKILDIGTGSGCISITLALEIPTSKVFATDISKDALTVAKKNAKKHKARVTFIHHDILKNDMPAQDLDVIVSNPPYITKREMHEMKANVIAFEPHLALFVPDDSPLLFYRTIVSKSTDVLKNGGMLAFEINEKYGLQVADLFSAAGFKGIQVIKDLSGKNRIVKGVL